MASSHDGTVLSCVPTFNMSKFAAAETKQVMLFSCEKKLQVTQVRVSSTFIQSSVLGYFYKGQTVFPALLNAVRSNWLNLRTLNVVIQYQKK